MKVNISGVGLIPQLGLLAPVYGRDLSKDTVSAILKYASFKVYVATTGIQITKKNIDELYGTVVKQAAAPAETVTKKAPKKAAQQAEIKQVETPVEFKEEVEAPAIEEEVEAVEVATEETSTIEEAPAEAVAETTGEAVDPQPTYNKKKKRH